MSTERVPVEKPPATAEGKCQCKEVVPLLTNIRRASFAFRKESKILRVIL